MAAPILFACGHELHNHVLECLVKMLIKSIGLEVTRMQLMNIMAKHTNAQAQNTAIKYSYLVQCTYIVMLNKPEDDMG